MSAEDRQGIPARIEAAVRAVPGVADVYPTGALASRIVDAGARLLGVRDGDAPLVRVDDGAGVRVEAAIGVRAGDGAGDVVRAARAAIRAVLDEPGRPEPEIRLTVVHVEDGPVEGAGQRFT
ncbi:hypothetical protein [Microbacterium karelineae]|uniref:hypothetical protein n=1 Tax=Microbacterium karelineae TaxID=2654283 RepID=UPI0012EAF50E|nr:hypothetical protein [Microbacterium karelineae]